MSDLGRLIWTTKARRLEFPVYTGDGKGPYAGVVTDLGYPKSFGEKCLELHEERIQDIVQAGGTLVLRPRLCNREGFKLRRALYHRERA